MREFNSTNEGFAPRARRRVILEISTLVFLVWCYRSDWTWFLPDWLVISILMMLSVYILIGLILLPKAKALTQSFSIYLMDGALGFPYQGHTKQIPYHDLSISKVTRKNGEVVTIGIKTVFGHSIELEGLENMNELYEELLICIGERKER